MKRFFLILILLPHFALAGVLDSVSLKNNTFLFSDNDPYSDAFSVHAEMKGVLGYGGVSPGFGIRNLIRFSEKNFILLQGDLTFPGHYQQTWIATADNSITMPQKLPYIIDTKYFSFDVFAAFKRNLGTLTSFDIQTYWHVGVGLGVYIFKFDQHLDVHQYSTDFDSSNNSRGGFIIEGSYGIEKKFDRITLYSELGAIIPPFSIDASVNKPGVPFTLGINIGILFNNHSSSGN